MGADTCGGDSGGHLEVTWKKVEPNYTKYNFTGTTGPTKPRVATDKIKDFFFLFFADEVWDLMVTETNRYASQCRASSSSVRPRAWRDVTVEEMQAFMGVMMGMGIL